MEKIREEAAIASSKIIPQKSKTVYNKEFKEFVAWCENKNVDVNALEENILLAYFLNVSKRVASSLAWTKYSMLICC